MACCCATTCLMPVLLLCYLLAAAAVARLRAMAACFAVLLLAPLHACSAVVANLHHVRQGRTTSSLHRCDSTSVGMPLDQPLPQAAGHPVLHPRAAPCRATASNGSQAPGTSELVIGRLRPSSSLVATTTRSPPTTAPLRLVNNCHRPPGRPITVELARPTADAVGSPTLVSTPPSDPKIRPPLDAGLLLVSFPTSLVAGQRQIDWHRHPAPWIELCSPFLCFQLGLQA
jgi:hypothetical protein